MCTNKKQKVSASRFAPWLVVAALPISALADVEQTLDSVDALTSRQVLEMRFGESTVPVPAYDDPVTASAPIVGTAPGLQTRFAACQRAGDRRLSCLLNSYTNPATGLLVQPVLRYTEAGSSETLFDCTDPALALDRRRANPCTSVTADLAGNVWIGGRDGQAHSLIKVVEVPTTETCGTDRNALVDDVTDSRGFSEFSRASPSGSKFCFRRYATGRPVIVDMLSIDSKAAVGFQGPSGAVGKGVLLLEDRRTAVFVADRKLPNGAPDTVAPVVLASGKSGFALIGNEAVQSVALSQRPCTGANCTANDRDNYLLATTSGGRVVAKRLDPLGPTAQVFPTLPATTVGTCASTLVPQYWVRVSRQTDQIFVADRSCQQVRAFASASDPLAALVPLGSLSTAPASSTTSLDTLSVSPGIGIDLADCFDEDCILVPDGPDTANNVGARLTNVEIVPNGRSGLTVFRIRNIPDCRHLPASACPAGAVVAINGQAYLDVAKLLPPEVLELFDDTTSPTLEDLELLIGPQYRARQDKYGGYTFEALFGRTEDGVLFRDVFDLEFDVGELVAELTGENVSRCGFQYAPITGDPDGWDAIVTVSERTTTAAALDGTVLAVRATSPATGPARHVDMLTNTFCTNPTATKGKTWSLYAYGLDLTDTRPDRFAHLLDGLFDDLERARVLSACRDVDGNGGVAPLSAGICSALEADWDNTRDKLNKCIGAAQAGKTSALDQTCNAFRTQFDAYIARLEGATPQGPDVANRYGELLVRIAVINYVYAQQFIKSVPPGGFQ
jgi:hypothetical protein